MKTIFVSTEVTPLPRLRLLDLIRGVALFGISVVNLPFMANTIYEELSLTSLSSLDQSASLLVSVFFQLKCYLLFAFVFGYSFGLQLTNGQTLPAASPQVAAFRRRLAGLFVFGLIDGIFLFVGDILISYSLLGLLLLEVRQWPVRRLWRAGIFALGLAIIVYLLAALSIGDNEFATSKDLQESARKAYLGSFWQGAAQRAKDLHIVLPFLVVVNWLPVLAMFSWGLAAAKSRTFANIEYFLRAYRTRAALALALGIPANFFFAAFGENPGSQEWVRFIAIALSPASALCLSFAYMYGIAWVHYRWPTSLVALEKMGRLSLSNYLGQALFGCYLFNGWGLGQLGRWTPAQLLLLAVAMFIVQLVISEYYLRWFLVGPDEWLLRSFSKLQWQPFRRMRSSVPST